MTMALQSYSARHTREPLVVSRPELVMRSADAGGSTRQRGARVVAAAGLAVAVWFHVGVAVDHLEEVPYLGWSFVAFIMLASAIAGSLLLESRTVVWWAALALSVATLALYAVSRTIGLPGASDDVGDWSNTAGIICGAAEIVVAVVAAAVLIRRHAAEAPTT
jgi:hypothetical protein